MKKLLLLVSCLMLAACSASHNFVFKEQAAVDTVTGLVWTRSANLPGKQLVWRGEENVYAFIQKMNGENYAGYADWRVPSKKEMKDLLCYARGMGYERDRVETWPYAVLGKIGFTDVRDYGYWTSTRYSTDEMWIADFATGEVSHRKEANPYFLWPVRGGR
ncbi:MAG: DUF1566 domain-containing protein [Geobacter sp.]|nr:DUF1566 domain-containing protein [Geobacter sp.]